MNLKDTYNKIAKDWHADHQQDDWWVEGTDTFIAFLEPGSRVLDVGCGAGNKSGYLVRHGLQVTGIDFSEELVAIARKEVPEADFTIADMRELSSLDLPKFDAIFAQASLLHIPRAEMESTLLGLLEHLKSGGYLYVAVKGARANLPLEEVKEENDYGYSYERFFSYFTLDELKDYFTKLGLGVVYENVHTVGKTDWIQVLGQKY